MKIVFVAGLLCASTSSPVHATWMEVANLDSALVAAPLAFGPENAIVPGIALADNSQAGTHDERLALVPSPQVTDASNIGLPVVVGSEIVDANSDFARLRENDGTVGNPPAASFGFSATNGLGGAYDDFDMRRIPGGGVSIAAIIGLLGCGLLVSGFRLGRQRRPQAPSGGRSFIDADVIWNSHALAASDIMMSVNDVMRPLNPIGGSSFWGANSLDGVVVYPAEPMFATVRSEDRFDNAMMPVADLDPGVVVVTQYRMYTLDGRTIRSFRDFIAADDSAALTQARRCEPTEGFELWRGNVCVTWQPQIQ